MDYLTKIKERNMKQMSKSRPKCSDCSKKLSDVDIEQDRDLIGICVECQKKRVEKWRKDNISKLMLDAGIPSKYHAFDEYVLKDSTKGIFLSGACGVGKTVMACQIAKHLILLGRKVKFYVFSDLIMKIHDIITANNSVYEFVKDIAKLDVLILDDLGAEKMSEYTRQLMYMLINEREMHDRQTIVTSNYTLDEIAEMIDPRITSRIKGMCLCHNLKGNDKRITKGAKAND